MKSSISTSETVMFYDTDCGGVVSNIAYLRFVERARSELLQQLGMGLAEMNETMLFPAVTRTEIDYRSPARLGDCIRVEAWLESVEKVRAICGFKLSVATAEGDGRIIATALQTVAMVQMPSARPRRIPVEWQHLIS